MKILVIIFVIFNNFVMFCGSMQILNNLFKGIVPHPVKPTFGLFYTTFIMFLMNLVILFYLLVKKDDVAAQPKKAPMKKVFIGFAWFAIIYLGSLFVAGMIVGGIAGSGAPDNPGEAGRIAGHDFFQHYGLYFFVASVLVAIVGTAKSLLPFTHEDDA